MNKIKTLAVAAALLGAGWSVSVVPAEANKKMSVEEHVKELKDKLKLTPDQETRVREAVQEKKTKVDTAMQEAHEKIRSTLNDDQRAKFNDMVAKKEKEMKD